MKLHILADLHIEFEHFKPPDTDADVVVLAGDIHLGRKGIEWAIQTFANKSVLYILGNHEFYGKALPKLSKELIKQAKQKNVIILDNTEIVLGGIRFLGCTLWTDFKLLGNPSVAGFKAQNMMIDYSRIRVSPQYRRLRPADTISLHSKSKSWLASKFRERFNGTTIVVSHHAPSIKSIPSALRNDLISSAYASDLEGLVSGSNAKLWIHGHIHSFSDYYLGKTRVICNPKGYPDEPVQNFDPKMVVEV